MKNQIILAGVLVAMTLPLNSDSPKSFFTNLSEKYKSSRLQQYALCGLGGAGLGFATGIVSRYPHAHAYSIQNQSKTRPFLLKGGRYGALVGLGIGLFAAHFYTPKSIQSK